MRSEFPPPAKPWRGENLNRIKELPGLTQKERMLLAFKAKGTVCGSTFLEMHIPRYAARVADLRDDGYDIVRVKCPYRFHDHGRQIASYEMRGRR